MAISFVILVEFVILVSVVLVVDCSTEGLASSSQALSRAKTFVFLFVLVFVLAHEQPISQPT